MKHGILVGGGGGKLINKSCQILPAELQKSFSIHETMTPVVAWYVIHRSCKVGVLNFSRLLLRTAQQLIEVQHKSGC